jgi:prepilin-type N-terminal cleavage/methylation domain-containing protein
MSSIRRGDDGGFSLLEVVVAMTVFTVMATVSLGIVLRTTGAARGNIERTQATSLVTGQIEAVRSMDTLAIVDGKSVTTSLVNGTTYTITQTANFVASDADASICSGNSSTLAYKLVTVTVTWPNMGTIKPVRADTLKAVGIGTDGLDATKGTLAIRVGGATNNAIENVTVTLSPGGTSRVTGSDGCAVFTGLTPGSYSATTSATGYVSSLNVPVATATGLGVAAGEVRRGAILLDAARTLVVATDAAAGAVYPAGLPLRVGSAYKPEFTVPACTTPVVTACTSGLPGTVQSLFPETYAVKVGTCIEATTALTSQQSIDLRPDAAAGATVTVPVASVKVDVKRGTASQAGRVVTFRHAAGSGCTAGETYTATTGATGVTVVLPYGAWTISTPNGAVTVSNNQTLSGSNKTPTVTLTVTT